MGFEEIFALIGKAAVGFVLLLACLWAVGSIRDWHYEIAARRWYKGVDWARDRLADDAWWFSEDPVTMHLLQRLAKGNHVGTVRDDWQRERRDGADADDMEERRHG